MKETKINKVEILIRAKGGKGETFSLAGGLDVTFSKVDYQEKGGTSAALSQGGTACARVTHSQDGGTVSETPWGVGVERY